MRAPPATLAWFRLDLRLRDNPAWSAAAALGAPVVPVYVWAPDEDGAWPPGAASRWWLHHALAALQASLEAQGLRLLLRRGPSAAVLLALARAIGAERVFWNRRYEPAARRRDAAVAAELERRGLQGASFAEATLYEPGTVSGRNPSRPLRVFTAFWRAAQRLPEPQRPLPAPGAVEGPVRWPPSLPLVALDLLPRRNWAAGWERLWRPGEAGAQATLRRFRRHLAAYPRERDRLAQPGTSALSPHLHFGEISVRQLWHAATGPGGADFRRQLGWRDFGAHLLWHFPHSPEEPLQPRFAAFPWRDAAAALRAWQRGRTGYPLVDAAMRQLWRTGWMHNRGRKASAGSGTRWSTPIWPTTPWGGSG
jgi:deoxyribodipyrimidine photo-lyase